MLCRFLHIFSYHSLIPSQQPPPDVSHQGLDIRASVVSRYLGVKVFPHPLNLVVIRTIRRKEVQNDPSTKRPHNHLRDPAGMDTIIVQDHMDHFRLWVCRRRFLQQRDKNSAALSFGLDPGQSSSDGIQRAGQISFDVRTRCEHLLLPASHRPIRANLRIQMDIHFILVHSDVMPRQSASQVARESN